MGREQGHPERGVPLFVGYREVQRALRSTFCDAIRRIFQLYKQGGQRARRSPEEQALLRERVRWLQEEETIEKMLPKIEEPGEQRVQQDRGWGLVAAARGRLDI